jgi:hypothetical protein
MAAACTAQLNVFGCSEKFVGNEIEICRSTTSREFLWSNQTASSRTSEIGPLNPANRYNVLLCRRIGRAVLVHKQPIGVGTHHVNIGARGEVLWVARSHFQINRHGGRFVNQVLTIFGTFRKRRAIASVQYRLVAIFDQRQLAFKQINELVFVAVPNALASILGMYCSLFRNLISQRSASRGRYPRLCKHSALALAPIAQYSSRIHFAGSLKLQRKVVTNKIQ